jgi:RAD51-like protein 2
MIPPGLLRDTIRDLDSPQPDAQISEDHVDLISYAKVHTAVDLFILLHNLPNRIPPTQTQNKLLVLNSLSFLFQPFLSGSVAQSSRNAFLDRLKTALVKLSATYKFSVVTTSQLSVRLLNADGTNGNFQTAVTSTMTPQLSPTYLPAGKAYRVMVVPETRSNGKLRLLSSPRNQTPEKGTWAQEDYVIVSSPPCDIIW